MKYMLNRIKDYKAKLNLRRMIVLVDQDGVLVQTAKKMQEELVKRVPGIKLNDYFANNSFLIERLYPAEIEPIFQDIWATPGLFYAMDPMPGAKEAIEEIAKKHQVFVCSQPYAISPNCIQEKYDSIGKHFGREWQKRTIFLQDKTLVIGSILIDDKPSIKGEAIPSWEHVAYGHLRSPEPDTRRRIT